MFKSINLLILTYLIKMKYISPQMSKSFHKKILAS